MKKIILNLSAMIIGIIMSANVNAQCINPFAFGSATFGPCSGGPIIATTCAFVSEYSTFNGLIAGEQYRFTHTSSSPDNYITLTDLENNILAHGPSPLIWTSTITGSIRFHYSNDADCTPTPGGCRVGSGECLTCPPAALATCDLAVPIGTSITSAGGVDVVTGNTACTGPAQNVPTCGTTLNTAAGQWFVYESRDYFGNAHVTTCVPFGTPSFDTKIGVFTGECLGPADFSGFVCVGGNDDALCPGGSGLLSTVNFEVEPYTTYWIYVTGFGAAQGPFQLTLSVDVTLKRVFQMKINSSNPD